MRSIGDQIPPRIHGGAVLSDLIMQMRAGAAARVAGVRDHLALEHLLSHAHRQPRVVAVKSRQPVAVIHRHQIAEIARETALHHLAVGRRHHRRAAVHGEIDPLVQLRTAAERRIAAAEPGRHRPLRRPNRRRRRRRPRARRAVASRRRPAQDKNRQRRYPSQRPQMRPP